MQLVLIAILALCGYFFLFQAVAKRAENKASLPLIAVMLLVIYGGIAAALFFVLSQLGSTGFMLIALLLLISCVVFFMGLYGFLQNLREVNLGMTVLYVLYVLMVGYVTIFSRREGHSTDILLRFDSVEEALRLRSVEPLNHLLLNVAMFVPLGLLFTLIYPERLNRLACAAVMGLMLSTLIETTQMLLRMGQCDIEDIAANTLGAVAGLLLYRIFRRFAPGEDEES